MKTAERADVSQRMDAVWWEWKSRRERQDLGAAVEGSANS